MQSSVSKLVVVRRGPLRSGGVITGWVLAILLSFGGESVASATNGEAAPAERIVEGAGQVAIHYRVYGSPVGDRPLVVLIHGWSCDSAYWREQIAPLSLDHTIVTVDLAGHGSSGDERDDFSMRSFGEDVQRVVASLPTRAPVILVGHSMGGPVAVEAAAILGDRVRAVIGVDTFVSIGAPIPAAAEIKMRIAPFYTDFRAATRALVDRSFFKPDADPVLRRWIVEDMANANSRVGIAALLGLGTWDGEAALRALRVPLIAINTDSVKVNQERIRELSPEFRLITIEGPGHFLMMENPERFNLALRAELAHLP